MLDTLNVCKYVLHTGSENIIFLCGFAAPSGK